MKKILFTTTIPEAKMHLKALQFFYVSNTKARVGFEEGLKELCPERMEIFEVNAEQMNRLDKFNRWLLTEIESAENQKQISK